MRLTIIPPKKNRTLPKKDHASSPFMKQETSFNDSWFMSKIELFKQFENPLTEDNMKDLIGSIAHDNPDLNSDDRFQLFIYCTARLPNWFELEAEKNEQLTRDEILRQILTLENRLNFFRGRMKIIELEKDVLEVALEFHEQLDLKDDFLFDL